MNVYRDLLERGHAIAHAIDGVIVFAFHVKRACGRRRRSRARVSLRVSKWPLVGSCTHLVRPFGRSSGRVAREDAPVVTHLSSRVLDAVSSR